MAAAGDDTAPDSSVAVVHPPWCGEPGATDAAPAEKPAAPACRPGIISYKVDEFTSFEVPENLKFLRCIGKGTYGSVAAFRDVETGRDVAIKKIANPFRNSIDGKRCLREIKLLRLMDHDCIIPLLDVLAPSSPSFNDVYIVTELMDADLHNVICSPMQLSDEHVQFFIYHILRALLYLHSANVVHRDLKPLNVLVQKNCDIKICDFGLARGRAGFSQEDDDFLRTEYVGTRWYRAPEVVLTSMEYTAAVDIWSAGCILGELVRRTPMFRGTDFLNQIQSICEVLGTPTDSDLSFIPEHNEAARNFIRARKAVVRKDWKELFPESSDLQRDLLDRMLRFDPTSRLSAREALRHGYLEEHHSEEDEDEAPTHVDWSFDDLPSQDIETLHRMVYAEALRLHPEIIERDKAELDRRGWLEDMEDVLASACPTPCGGAGVLHVDEGTGDTP